MPTFTFLTDFEDALTARAPVAATHPQVAVRLTSCLHGPDTVSTLCPCVVWFKHNAGGK